MTLKTERREVGEGGAGVGWDGGYYSPARHQSPSSSVDRTSERCTEGHPFDSCRGLDRIFLCSTLFINAYLFYGQPSRLAMTDRCATVYQKEWITY